MSKVFLTYFPTSSEGPEPQRLGPPYDILITPGQPFECAADLAKTLIGVKPQFKITDANGVVKAEPEKSEPKLVEPAQGEKKKGKK